MLKILEKPVLPKEVFQAEAAPRLLAQAVRVFLANQQQGTQSALTRSEVNRTRKKLYRQKGTGGARHGDRKAPIFVGGGVTFAPKPRDLSLSLPQKMKRQALLGALTIKAKEKNLQIVSGMAELTGKTKELASFLTGQSWLIITDTFRDKVYRAARNLAGGNVLPVSQLSTYDVLRVGRVLMMEEAIPILAKSSATKAATKPAKEAKKEVKKIPTRKPVVKSRARK